MQNKMAVHCRILVNYSLFLENQKVQAEKSFTLAICEAKRKFLKSPIFSHLVNNELASEHGSSAAG